MTTQNVAPTRPPEDALDRRCPDGLLATARRFHIIGVAGTAMGTFAGMLARLGHEVRGSDRACYPPMSDQLAASGIPVSLGYRAENLDWSPDLVIVGNVVRRDNPEAVAVRERGLPHLEETTWRAVEQSLDGYAPWTGPSSALPRITIDSVESLGSNVDAALAFIAA